MNFVTGFPVFTNWKDETYDSILVIVDWLIKMINYKSVKVLINIPDLAEVIINMIVQHHGFVNSINCDQGSVFTLTFWLLLYYFLDFK